MAVTITNLLRRNSCTSLVAATSMHGLKHGFARARFPPSSKLRRFGSGYWMNSPHFWTDASAAPQGIMGTEEVEFFGDPSISLSEYTM